MSEVESEVDAVPERTRFDVAALVIAILFALFYGYALYDAISNLVVLPSFLAALGAEASTPWALLILGLVIPPVLYAAALLVGRGRPLFARALILIVGLAVVHTLALSLIAVVSAVVRF